MRTFSSLSPTLSNEMHTNFTIARHETKPTIHHSFNWKSALSSKLSRRKIDHLIKFLVTNDDLIKSQNYNTDTNSSLEIDTSTDSQPGTRNSMNSQSSS
ncbi:hypothetical protein AVEN_53356-1 [Araneus ventricosus]|uniref:Uncharacterized protein n=1 Tax=Araneus ventricosus TaxID=182803 RepID=A0A4Y2ABD0_ARAVE|nr:hypothetical protein AVEN_53356-1 [Araneus ventricosus]